MYQVIKRDGTIVDFNREKVINAINAAFLEVDDLLYETDTVSDIADEIGSLVAKSENDISVEVIQNKIEELLMRSERPDVARAYIRFRYKREVAREYKADFMKAYSEKLEARDVKNQNANVDEHSFGGRMGEANSLMTKQYALDFCVSPMAKKNHLENMIYIHDLDSYAVGMHNCLSIPFDDLLAKGFDTRQTDVRPAGSVNTAMQLVAVIFQLQSLQQFGGVSATHLDWTMVPYVRKSFMKHYLIEYLKSIEEFYALELDNMTEKELDRWISLNKKYYLEDLNLKEEDFYFDNKNNLNTKFYQCALFETRKEVYQAVEGLYHNLNTLQSRSGNQLPFTSINYGTCILPEGRMVTKALLEVLIEGLGSKKKTSIFPCGIFQSSKNINRYPGTPNYDLYQLALRATAQRLYPNYANIDWSGNAGYDPEDPTTYFSTMGCRTANGWDINGLGQRKDGRGNICPVTIIMPTLAMIAKEKALTNSDPFEENLEGLTIDNFLQLLDTKIHEAKDMLIERFEWICSQDPKSAKFMYENGLMAGYVPEEGIRSALKHGTLAIGQLGLAETLQILVGCDHTEETGMELAKRIEQLFKDKCAKFKEEYKLNFGVYYTPAENLCYTAMSKFKARYGEIPNVSDKDYFTNSMHVPVWKEMSPLEKIDIESELTGYSSAGCITYIELDAGVKNNLEALEQLVNYAMEKDIPYFAINVPNDQCVDCGYIDEIGEKCPVCGNNDIRRLRRVTGYLTGDYKTAFNYGKQKEVEDRVKHK
jgi:ribonucleoside-triphosphate reductase